MPVKPCQHRRLPVMTGEPSELELFPEHFLLPTTPTQAPVALPPHTPSPRRQGAAVGARGLPQQQPHLAPGRDAPGPLAGACPGGLPGPPAKTWPSMLFIVLSTAGRTPRRADPGWRQLWGPPRPAAQEKPPDCTLYVSSPRCLAKRDLPRLPS